MAKKDEGEDQRAKAAKAFGKANRERELERRKPFEKVKSDIQANPVHVKAED